MGRTLTIFRNKSSKENFHNAYDKVLKLWPEVDSIFVETEYSRAHLLVLGPKTAPPLLLLHGMTLSSTSWYRNIQHLSKYFRVYCLDLPADFGKSNIKKILKTSKDYINFFNQLISKLNIEEYSLIGHSFGGFLALTYALSNPTGLKNLILLAPAGSIYRLPLMFYAKTMPPALFPSEKRIRVLCNYFLSRNNLLKETINDEYFNQLVVSFTNCFPKNQILPRVFMDDELRSLKTPTLLMVGEEEVIYNPLKATERFKELVPNTKIKIIPNSSHMLICEQPELVNDTIVKFLDDGKI